MCELSCVAEERGAVCRAHMVQCGHLMTLNAKAARQHDQLRPGGRSESWGVSGTVLSESMAWVCEPGKMRSASECCLDADARAGCGRACEIGHGRVIKIRRRAKSLKPLVLSSDLPA